MANSAVRFVIDKLFLLLTNEADLLGGIHGEVADIRDELESMQSFLTDADIRIEQEDADSGMKTWVKQVRELAYQIADVIDEYMLCVAQHHDRHSFLHDIFWLVKKIKPRHQIASKIQDLKSSVRTVRERSERYSFASSSDRERIQSNNTWHDPRVASLFIDEAELVGIEVPKNELISRLVDGPSKNIVISVVGMGGLGKTTLVRKVYEHQRVTAQFDCYAWITVSPSYKIEQLIRTMLKEFQSSRKEPSLEGIEKMEELQVIVILRKYLSEKRYVVVFDDVWKIQFWEHISHALPDNDKGSRIIITTRNEEVAPSFNVSSFYQVYKLLPLNHDKALELFHKKVFQSGDRYCTTEFMDLSHAIVDRCEGLPLAVVTIGGLLATKEKSLLEWKKLYDGLRSALASNQRVASITKVLSLSYHDLPCYLKACFLYFGMFPEDYSVPCSRLIRLWMAEGFIKERQGITQEEVAEEYLNELILRSLVQVVKPGSDGKARSCRVHDLMHDIIMSRSGELNFHQVFVDNYRNRKGIGRHLAIHDRANNLSESTGNSKPRSILLFCVNELPTTLISSFIENFKLLKVMDFEGAPLHCIPDRLGSLKFLSYLSLKNTHVKTLPRSIGRLRQLETLDLRGAPVHDLPIEINRLLKLRYLLAYSFSLDQKLNPNWCRGLKVHSSIGCLKDLRKLRLIEVDQDIGLIKDLEMLTQLRTLGIRKLKRENGPLMCTALEKMSNLKSLNISSVNEEELLELQSISFPPPLLERLYLYGPVAELPRWISKLKSLIRVDLRWSKLGDDALEVLQDLPHLLELEFYEACHAEKLHFRKGCFQKLKVLNLRHLIRLKLLIIDNEALPTLEEFLIGPFPRLKEVPPGIHSLRNLKLLRFRDIQREFAIGMLPNTGQDYWKIKHIPAVFLDFTTVGVQYLVYRLDDSNLLKHLENED